MYKREIWYAIVHSKETKQKVDILYSLKTSVIGSTLSEVTTLSTNLKSRVQGNIYNIEFLKQTGLTTYKL